MTDFKAGDFVRLTESGESMISGNFEADETNYKIGMIYKINRVTENLVEICALYNSATTSLCSSDLILSSEPISIKDELTDRCKVWYISDTKPPAFVGTFVGMTGYGRELNAVLNTSEKYGVIKLEVMSPYGLTSIDPFSKENKAKALTLRIAKELYKIGESAFDFDLDWDHSSDYCKERYIKMVNLGVRVKGIK